MQNSSSHQLSRVAEYALYGLAVATPFIFLPFSTTMAEGSKFLLIFIGLLFILPMTALYFLKQRQPTFTAHALLLPLTLYGGSILASALFSHPYPLESLSGLYGAQIALILVIIAATQFVKISNPRRFLQVLAVIGSVLTGLSFLQVGGVGITRMLNPLFNWNLPHTIAFQLTGSIFVTFTLLLIIETGLLAYLWMHRKFEQHIFEVVSAIIIGVGILLHCYFMFINKQYAPILLPFSSNWVMLTDLLKNAKTAFLGVGPERFQDAYTSFKPVWHNTQSYWNVVFQTGRNTPLSDAISIGLLGVFSWIFLVVQSVRLLLKSSRSALPIAVITVSALLLQLLIPANYVLLAIQSIAMIIWIGVLKDEHHPSVSASTLSVHYEKSQTIKPLSFVRFLIPAFLLIVMVGSGYYLYKVTTAEYFFVQSLKAAEANDGVKTYDFQRQAIQRFPYKDLYHRSYAQTNFALASSLSSQKDLNDTQKQTAVQLLQQAIEESKIATQLNPAHSTNWLITASIYQGLTGSITDAEKWAIAAYVRAIESDPNNPLLRIDLGNIFYQQEDFNQAAQLFNQAAQLKPDLPGAYYNLGRTMAQVKQYDTAIAAYRQTLTLLDSQSEEYTQVEDELGVILKEAEKVKAETPPAAAADGPQESDLPESVRENTLLLEKEGQPEVESISTGSAQATDSATTE